MANTRGYLFFTRQDDDNTNTTYSGLNEDQVVGGTENSTTVLVAGDLNPNAPTGAIATADLALDPHRQTYFYVDQAGGGTGSTDVDFPVIYSGSTTTGATSTTPLYSANIAGYNYQSGDTILINDLVVDQVGGRIFFTQQYEVPLASTRGIDKPVLANTGLYYISESGGAAVTVAVGFSNANVLALDLAHNIAFVTDSTGVGYSGDQTASHNSLDVVNLTTGAVTVLLSETYHPDAAFGTANYGGNVLDGLAIDTSTDTLYYTTGNEFNDLTTDSYSDTNYGVYKVGYTVTGSGASASATLGATTTLYSGAATYDPARITIDTADGVFYTTGDTLNATSGYPSGQAIYEGSLSSINGTTLTRVTPVSETNPPTNTDGSNNEEFGYTTFDVPGDGNIALDVVPTVTAGTTVTYAVGAAPVGTDSSLATSSATSAYYISATVAITGFQTGDVLAATVTGTSITQSYSNGTLTLSGSDTVAHYRQVLDSVTYATNGSNPTASGTEKSRTLTYLVYDGITTGTATSTVDLDAAPIVAPGSPTVTFTGGGGAVTADPVLTITDYTATTLAGATVKVASGFLTGDTLGFTSQSGISGTYNATAGVLTLTGAASVANYQVAIRSITFGFSPGNADPTAGNDTSRTLSYTVTDGTVASAAVTSTVSVVHAPPTVSASGTVAFTRGSTAVAVDPGLTLAAPDSAGQIASASVTITTGFAAGDMLAFTNQNGISGTFSGSTLSLTGTATAAQYQAALDGVTFATGNAAATGNRTLSYAVNDGIASSTAGTSTVTVAVPTPSITGAAANQAVSDEGTIQPFAALMVGDVTGESITGTTITVKAAGVASDADGLLSGNGLTKTGAGTYTLAAAAPGTLSGELAALSFTPTPHQVAPGSTVTTGFTVAVTDTGGGAATNTATTVVATAAADAPTVTGTHGPTSTTDLLAVQPFTGVGISEVDFNTNPTVTIEVRDQGVDTDANGILSGTGLTETATPGIYTLAAASPGTLTSEIDALTFTPTHDQVAIGQTVTTTFEITAANAGLTFMDGVTSVQATDVACFCAGTRIATPDGEVAVEALAAGDLVLTASGAARPVRWIGRRSYAGRFLRADRAAWPIRIRAGALADNVPLRDLRVSSLHAMFIDGLLIPAGELLDGVAVTRELVDEVQYFHVELDSHDVLLADGAPAESFLDDGSLGLFHNAASHPASAPGADGFCAPRVTDGFAVEAIRVSIEARARAAAAA